MAAVLELTTEAMDENVTHPIAKSSNTEVAIMIRVIALPIIIAVGSVGNGLSFLVLVRRRMRTNSIYSYLLMLTCVDTAILYLSGFKTWIREITDFELLHVSSIACKLLSYLLLVSWYASSWLIVLMTVDRFIAVWFPLKASHLCTVTRARLFIGLMLLIAAVSNLHIFWTFDLTYDASRQRLTCYGDSDVEFMESGHFELLKLASYCFVPFAIVLTLNCAIIHRLRHAQNTIQQQTNSAMSNLTSPSRSQNVHRKITYMLLTVSFSWFIMTAPFSLQIFLGKFYLDAIYKTLIFLLMYTNHSVNFLLYCITGRKFRHEVERLFCCRSAHCGRNEQDGNRKFTSKTRLSDQTDGSSDEKIPLRTTVTIMKSNSRDKPAAV